MIVKKNELHKAIREATLRTLKKVKGPDLGSPVNESELSKNLFELGSALNNFAGNVYRFVLQNKERFIDSGEVNNNIKTEINNIYNSLQIIKKILTKKS